MKFSHRLATCLVAVAAAAAAVVAPATGEASYPATAQPTTSVEAAMSTTLPMGTDRRRFSTRRLSVRATTVITVGDKLVVKGRSKLRRARARLQVKRSGRWRRVDRARTSARGAFRVSEVVRREGRHRFRVVVSPRRGRNATATFRVDAVPRPTTPLPGPTTSPVPTPTSAPPAAPPAAPTATPPPVPTPTTGAGDPNDWSYITGGKEPLAWNSCSTITWGYKPAGEYPGARADWEKAFAIVSERSGLRFEYGGTTGALEVSWSDAATDSNLAGGVVGFGGPSYRYIDPSRNGGVRMLIVGGRVVLDREAPLSPGHATSGRAAWGQVMVHELMHAVGLGHASGRAQIMYPSTGALVLGAGDHTGLHNVGSSRGCLSTKQYAAADAPAAGGRGEVLVHDHLRDVS